MSRFWAALPLLAGSVAAQADWQAVRWGMTPEAVIAAGGGEIKVVPDKKSERINTDQRLATGKAIVDGISYKQAYFFRPPSNELVMVQFEPKMQDCAAAIVSYNSRFGEAKPAHFSKAAPPSAGQIIISRYEWQDTNRGDLIRSAVASLAGFGIKQCYFLHMKLEA